MAINETFKDTLFNNTSGGHPDPPESATTTFAVLICLSAGVYAFLNIAHLRVLRHFDGFTEFSTICQRYASVVNIIWAASFALSSPLIVNNHWHLRNAYCICFGFVLSIGTSISVYLSGLLEFDRLFAVVAPFRYTQLATKRIAHVVVAGNILCSSLLLVVIIAVNGTDVIYETKARTCLMAFHDVFPDQIGQAIVFSFFTASPIFLVVTYTWLLCVTYKHSRIITEQERAVRNNLPPCDNEGFLNRIQHIQKASLALVANLVAYVIIWGPYCASLSLLFVNVSLPFWADMAWSWCLLGSTAINILIPYIFKSKYRLAIKESIFQFIQIFRRLDNAIGLEGNT